VRLLREKVENKKLGATTKPRRKAVIRPGTDKPRSRRAPRAVKRVVWREDAGQCAFVAPDGRRCSRKHLVALRGRHNQYEAELIFGRRPPHTRNGTQGPGS